MHERTDWVGSSGRGFLTTSPRFAKGSEAGFWRNFEQADPRPKKLKLRNEYIFDTIRLCRSWDRAISKKKAEPGFAGSAF
jgi:hypothetical protein